MIAETRPLIEDTMISECLPTPQYILSPQEIPTYETASDVDFLSRAINEANALSGIGQNKLRELTLDPRCPFVLFVGRKRLIKRKAFEAFIDKELEI